MSWFVVGGIAIGATAGAIVGSKKGGDDVWKDALIGGAIGGAGAGVGAAAFAPAAEAAVPVVAGEGAGILGAEAAVGGSGLALGGAGLETGGAMAGGAGIAGGAAPAAATVAPEAGAGILGGGAAPAALPGGASFGGTGGATVGSTGGFAPGMQAPIQMVSAPSTGGGTFGTAEAFGANPAALPGGASFGGSGGATVGETGGAANLGGASQSPLEKGFGSAMSWLSEPKNAMLTGVLGLGALSMFNKNNEDNFGSSNVQPAGYPLSPNFKPSRYQPTRTYAAGGVADTGSQNTMYPQSQIPDRTQFSTPTQMPASMEVLRSDYDTRVDPYTGEMPRFAKGGDTSKYQAMIDPKMNVREEKAPRWVGESVANVNDPGIYVDRDDDTKYQDALTAAQTRMGKTAAGANVRLGAMQKPTPLGKVNLGPVAGAEEERKAAGGIASLGSYAHGGNARLLKGPGDGMSDDIPATIGGEQPARLADGEFVVPADVVSGLGNGSTEAGAKKLHQMMDKVRVDRTGTKKQGKQIKAEKYVPGMASGGIAGYADGGQAQGDGALNWPVGDGGVDYNQYYVYDAQGNQVPMSMLLNAAQAQTATPSPTAATTQQGFGLGNDYWKTGAGNIRYTPYTLANRPSAAEPQFYGNIYKPTYENYTNPNYDLGANLGRWDNVAPSFNEQAYLQQKMQQLKDTGYQGPYTGTTAAELKDFIQNQAGMTLPEHYQRYGQAEGLNPYVKSEAQPQAPSLAADIAAAQAPKTEKKPEEKKARKGGILAAKKK